MCSLQRNYDVIRNWERFETGSLTVVSFAYKICKHYNLDQDQAGQNIGPDLHPNCLTLKEFLEKVDFLGYFLSNL